jgi:L-lactate utilization protein LutC
VTIPRPDLANIHPLNPIASSAAAKEHRHYAVPVHDAPSEVLIEKALPPLEIAAKTTEKKIRIRTIRHTDCIEVGHDRFDEKVSEILARIGEENVVSINTLNYTHMDIATRQLMTDFGVMIVYKG